MGNLELGIGMVQALAGMTEADDVQRQMREIRAELRDDVKELMVSAQQMGDWKRYVRAYPWLCVGGALAAGFFLVPQRAVVVRPDAEGLIELAKRNKLVVKMEEGSAAPKKRGGLLAQLASLALSTLLHGGMKIVTQQLTQAMSAPSQPHSNGRPGVHHE